MSNPEAPFFKDGNVMYVGAASIAEVDPQLRAGVLPEAKLLESLLADSHDQLVNSGIAQKIVDLDRARTVYAAQEEIPVLGQIFGEALLESPERFLELSAEYREDPEGFMERFSDVDGEDAENNPLALLEERSMVIDDSTQFRVAESLEAEEPCDELAIGGTLYVIIYNGDGQEEQSMLEVGSRIYGRSDDADVVIPNTPDVPPDELHLIKAEVARIGSIVDRFKKEMADDRLPHLGRSGLYDTLVVEVPENIDLAQAA